MNMRHNAEAVSQVEEQCTSASITGDREHARSGESRMLSILLQLERIGIPLTTLFDPVKSSEGHELSSLIIEGDLNLVIQAAAVSDHQHRSIVTGQGTAEKFLDRRYRLLGGGGLRPIDDEPGVGDHSEDVLTAGSGVVTVVYPTGLFGAAATKQMMGRIIGIDAPRLY
jgi:hypothetical protein